MDSQSENHPCPTCDKNLRNYFDEKADIARHEEQCKKFYHLIVRNNSNYSCSICNNDVKFYQYGKILEHMVESHDETPSTVENSTNPEENSNEISEKTQPITEEPLPNPSSTEASIEINSSDAKTIKWEQELKSNGYILCDCRTGFLDLNGKNISKYLVH